MLADKYIPSLNQKVKFQEPVTYPDMGIWHPMSTTMFEDVKGTGTTAARIFQMI